MSRHQPRLQPGTHYGGWEILGDDPRSSGYLTRCPLCQRKLVKARLDMQRGTACIVCYRRLPKPGSVCR